ncbi:MAG: cysteine desulfurase family protein [Proteobacteria bacterium]|nr:cysteine desulfurase family protein [Pseudomonadota bacterium]
MVYLDYNASAPMLDAVTDTVVNALRLTGNPSSVHSAGRAVRAVVEEARGAVAEFTGALAQNVIFTSGATEANNLAIKGVGCKRVIVSAIEHASVLEPSAHAEILPVDSNGVVDLASLEAILKQDLTPALVSVMLANNETGVIQPIEELATIAHEFGALFHCDAVQAPGRLGFSMTGLQADMVTISAHKIGGPRGAGALILGNGIDIQSEIDGGGQERGRRGGTENVGGIAGFGRATALAAAALGKANKVRRLRDHMEERILHAVPGAVIHGAATARLPNTSCIGVAGVPAETQVIAMDLAGVAVSAGAACSSGKVRFSHVLRAMGVPEADAGSAIRVSMGTETSEDDIAHFLDAWTSHIKMVKGRASAA